MNKQAGKISTGRLWLVFVGLCLIATGIFARIITIQFVEHDHWSAKGAEYTQSIKSIKPYRGQILARDGSLLAISVPTYNLSWDSQCEGMEWDSLAIHKDEMCSRLSKILGKSEDHYKLLLETAIANEKRYTLFGRNIPYTKYKELKAVPFLSLHKYDNGFVFERNDDRRKPFGQLAGRTIGIDRDDRRVGIELAWNKALSGVEGKQVQKRIAGGTWTPVTDEYLTEPQNGLDVVTTIDMHLQDVASSSLEKQLIKHKAAWGIVALMEVETGYIRAISNLTRTENAEGEGKYYESFNHALGSAVEPGSTFKLASLMACLESGRIQLNDSIDTGDGIAYFHRRPMKDSNWKNGGHGKISLKQVFTMSSNIGSAYAVKQCFSGDPQKFLDELQKIGVSAPLGINLVGEGTPHVYSTVGEGNWSGLSLTQMAIGYEVTQTPLQTLALYNAVANNGVMLKPVFVKEIQKNGTTMERFGPEVVNERICSAKTLEACKTMMESVCIPNGEGTAAKLFTDSPYSVAGKTGTCKIAHNGSYADGRYRASFTGYFPAENPKYTCIVVISDTKSGSYYGSTIAAPVFRELADLIYATDPSFHKINTEPLLPTEEQHLPTANDGAREELEVLYNEIGIAYADLSGGSDWVSVSTKQDSVVLATRTIQPLTMPNVKGMGLKDALYLLENAGIKVSYEGTGVVNHQSVPPGTPFTRASTIKLRLS